MCVCVSMRVHKHKHRQGQMSGKELGVGWGREALPTVTTYHSLQTRSYNIELPLPPLHYSFAYLLPSSDLCQNLGEEGSVPPQIINNNINHE